MEWQSVDSTAIQAVKHDGDAMHIRYASGAVYVHHGVPRAKFDQFLEAPSKGKHFNQHIAKQHPGRMAR